MTKLEILKRGIKRAQKANRITLSDYFYKECRRVVEEADNTKFEADELKRRNKQTAREIKLRASQMNMHKAYQHATEEMTEQGCKIRSFEEIQQAVSLICPMTIKPWWKLW